MPLVHKHFLGFLPVPLRKCGQLLNTLMATKIYLFARHVHTSLSTCDVNGSLVATFPVIERQWGAVAHLNDAIYDA